MFNPATAVIIIYNIDLGWFEISNRESGQFAWEKINIESWINRHDRNAAYIPDIKEWEKNSEKEFTCYNWW